VTKDKEKLSRNLKLLVGTNIINNILFLFLNTFFIAYFYTLTNYDYKIISIYYIFVYVVVGLTFWLLGDIVKTKNKLIVYRLGIVLHCAYILIIALLKENILQYYILLGAFYGFIQGTYWSGGHTLINQETEGAKTTKYVSAVAIIGKMAKIIFPIVFGTSIELTSFSNIALYVLILSLTQFTLSLFITDKSDKDNNFNLIKYMKYVRDSGAKVKHYYKIIFYEGIVKNLLETLIVIVIIMTFKSSMNLGILTTIFSICSMITVYVFQKFYKEKEPKKLLYICALVSVISVALLVCDISKITVVAYNFINSIFMVILYNYSNIKRYNCINTDKLKEFTVEHQAMSDVYLAISRVLGYFVLFVTSFFNTIIPFKILLVVISICIVRYTKLLSKV